MRTRRQVLVGGTAAFLGLAGCLEEVPEEDGDEEGADGGNDTDEDGGTGDGMGGNRTDGGNETDGADGDDAAAETAEFEVRSFTAPSTVEVGEAVEWSLVTVENTGGADGTYEASLTVRNPGGEEVSETVSVDVPTGETGDAVVSFRHDYVGEYVYALEGADEEAVVNAEVREVSFGDAYTNPDGATVTVDGGEEFYDMTLTPSYTYTDDEGETRFDRADDGMEYAVVSVRATKETRELVDMPRREEFTLFVGDEAYDAADRLADDEYEGGTTRGRTREGVLMFEVHERFGRNDTFEVYWTRDYDGGSAEVLWST
jgi:hypothetical protein